MPGLTCRLSALAILCIAAALQMPAAPPLISDPTTPADLVLVEGGSGFIRVLGSAGTNGTVRWFKDGTPLIPGPAGNTLSFSGVLPGDAGGYHVVLSNAEGTVTSRLARVVVPPSLAVTRVANVPTTGSALSLAVDGDRLFVGLGDGPAQVAGLEILDVSEPATPVLVGSYRLPREGTGLRVRDVAVQGTRAYLAAGAQGVRVLDIADPASPQELGVFTSRFHAVDLVVVGTRVYVVSLAGMTILDASDPAAITVLGHYPAQNLIGIDVQGNLAVVASAVGNDEVLDVTDPTKPVRLGTLRLGDPVKTVRLRGRQLVVSGGDCAACVRSVPSGVSAEAGRVCVPGGQRGHGAPGRSGAGWWRSGAGPSAALQRLRHWLASPCVPGRSASDGWPR